jgi:DNA invertase Pin-like site-specific DNA recombinase
VRCARYLRVSKVDQNPELQDDETRDFINKRNWNLTHTYLDHGISGSRERRPELDRMLSDARRKRFDAIVVWRSDRLFRSLRHMVVTLDELAGFGVAFSSVTEPFDTATASGRLLIHLVSAMAEFEKMVLVERTKAGVAAAVRRGAKVGRPRRNVNLEKARRLRDQGMTVREVASELQIGVATLHRAMGRATATAIAASLGNHVEGTGPVLGLQKGTELVGQEGFSKLPTKGGVKSL